MESRECPLEAAKRRLDEQRTTYGQLDPGSPYEPVVWARIQEAEAVLRAALIERRQAG